MSWRTAGARLRRIRDERGQDLLEYGLLMALIAVVAIAGVRTIGTTINSVFWDVIANYH
jgi:Flp pilus assembly pilin Flp